MNVMNRFLNVPSDDPDDARRRRLLNIVLLGFSTAGMLSLLTSTYVIITAPPSSGSDNGILVIASSIFLLLTFALFFINRYWSGQVASYVLIIFLTFVPVFIDNPTEVIRGRSLIVFALPIVLAGVLLPPTASFVIAALSAIIIIVYSSFTPGTFPNTPALILYFAIAFISWLSNNGLENALHELRATNQELDQRVADRTRELSDALRREQAEAHKNQAILQSIADGVIVFDENGRAIVSNPAINGLLERPTSRIVGATVEELMDTVPPDHQLQVRALFAGNDVHTDSTSIVWGDKTLSVRVAPLKLDATQTTGAVAVFRDVTREAEINRMKSMIVAMVSHELRTPLGAIQGLAEVLREGVYGSLNDKQQQTIDRVILNAKRLIGMVRDLLDQAQIEAGTLRIECNTFLASELLDTVRDTMAETARQKGLQLLTKVDESFPVYLNGDMPRLIQIGINLVGNALKFTEQGSVTVRLYQPDTTHWAMEVIDTGPGIPISAEAYIFDPFWQIDGSSGRRHGGVGLGLSIVRRLVNLMNGEIKLSSRIGRGTTFTVLLPMQPPVIQNN
jgi:signal transduction histidine kinase